MEIAAAAPAPIFGRSVEWEVSPGLVDYPAAVSRMERLAASIARREHPEQVWLLEHPPLYTAGTSARDEHLLDPARFPCSGRGAAVNSPIMALASGSLMSCWT